MLIAVTKHSDLHLHDIHAKAAEHLQIYKTVLEFKDKQVKVYALFFAG
jgi:hypothetical protein